LPGPAACPPVGEFEAEFLTATIGRPLAAAGRERTGGGGGGRPDGAQRLYGEGVVDDVHGLIRKADFAST